MTTGRLLILGPFFYLVLFFLYPLMAILARSLNADSFMGLGPFSTLLTDSYYLERIWFTIWQATVSTLFTVAVGLPVAYLFAKHRFPGKTVLKAVSTIPFIMPTIVVAMGFLALLGPQGIVNSVLVGSFDLDAPPVRISNTLLIIFMAHAFYNYSIVVRIVSTFWANLSPRLEESAAMLGAGRFETFVHVTLPLLLPAIVSSAVLAFAFAFTSFGVVLILGGPEFATLEVVTYELAAKLFRLELAGALAIIQLVFTYLFLVIYTKFQAGAAVQVELVPRGNTSMHRRRLRDTVFVFSLILGLLAILSPLWALLERAISSGEGYSLVHFISLFSNETGSYFYRSPLSVIGNSVRFAICTMVIAVTVGTIVSYYLARSQRQNAGILDAIFMMPLGVSAVIMGFGFLIAFDQDPMDLRASWTILVIAHSLIAYPFVIRSVLPTLRGIPIHLREAAAVLGASPAKTFFHIDMPILSGALLVGATFAFAVSMGEFGASLLLVRPEFTTIPVAIFRLLGQPGDSNIGQAVALSTILMVIVAIGFILIERFRYKDMGGF